MLVREWDILCAVDHNCHDLATSTIHTCGYSSFYAKHLKDHSSWVVLNVWDKYFPQVVYDNHLWSFFVVEITHFGEVVWLVGIYASNEDTQDIALWRSRLRTLRAAQDYLWMT